MPEPLDPTLLGFRPLSPADAPLLHRWLNAGDALRWYAQEQATTLDEIAREYDAARDPTTHRFLITYGGQPIGYLQWYRQREHADWWAWLAMADAAGIDLFIGEPAYLHRGLGAPLILRFLCELLFADPTIASCVIDPVSGNAAAIRAYEKAGFVHFVPDREPPEALRDTWFMRLDRERMRGS